MKKNGWDSKVPDFIWNKNRLALEIASLKESLKEVINKPIKAKETDDDGREEQKKDMRKIDKNSIAVN
jgi:hypothetical protein